MTPFPGVRLGPLVGKGSFGKVYRGIWNNNVVAIKVCGTHAMLYCLQFCYAVLHSEVLCWAALCSSKLSFGLHSPLYLHDAVLSCAVCAVLSVLHLCA